MEIYFQAGRRTTKGGGGAWAFFLGVGFWIVEFGFWILDWGDAKNGIFPFDFLGGVLLVTYTFLKVVGLWRMGLEAKNGILAF